MFNPGNVDELTLKKAHCARSLSTVNMSTRGFCVFKGLRVSDQRASCLDRKLPQKRCSNTTLLSLCLSHAAIHSRPLTTCSLLSWHPLLLSQPQVTKIIQSGFFNIILLRGRVLLNKRGDKLVGEWWLDCVYWYWIKSPWAESPSTGRQWNCKTMWILTVLNEYCSSRVIFLKLGNI